MMDRRSTISSRTFALTLSTLGPTWCTRLEPVEFVRSGGKLARNTPGLSRLLRMAPRLWSGGTRR